MWSRSVFEKKVRSESGLNIQTENPYITELNFCYLQSYALYSFFYTVSSGFFRGKDPDPGQLHPDPGHQIKFNSYREFDKDPGPTLKLISMRIRSYLGDFLIYKNARKKNILQIQGQPMIREKLLKWKLLNIFYNLFWIFE